MSFWSELRRRNVFKVAAAYVIVAWLVIEVASIVLPTFQTPQWVMQALVFLLFIKAISPAYRVDPPRSRASGHPKPFRKNTAMHRPAVSHHSVAKYR